MDIHVKFGDSRSNRFLFIRATHFVMDDEIEEHQTMQVMAIGRNAIVAFCPKLNKALCLTHLFQSSVDSRVLQHVVDDFGFFFRRRAELENLTDDGGILTKSVTQGFRIIGLLIGSSASVVCNPAHH